jgi:hypothetical protein
MQDPETLRLMRERAARVAQRNRGDGLPVGGVDTSTRAPPARSFTDEPADRGSGAAAFDAGGGGGGDGGGD